MAGSAVSCPGSSARAARGLWPQPRRRPPPRLVGAVLAAAAGRVAARQGARGGGGGALPGAAGEVCPDGAEPWATRCNILRVPLPPGGQLGRLPCGDYPYIAEIPAGRNAELAAELARDRLLATMGNATCTPSQAGSIRRGIAPMSLSEYVEDWMGRSLSRDPSQNRYVFGEFGEQWAPLRDIYVPPPCASCSGSRAAITIGLGGLHSGAPWHTHNAAFVEMLHGSKHFALLPPEDEDTQEIREAIANLSQLHWHRDVRPLMERAGRLARLQECVIRPGELLYFPDNWFHGAVNMHSYTGFVSTFVEQDSGADFVSLT